MLQDFSDIDFDASYAIGETVNLTVREGDEVIYIERVTSHRMMRVEQVIGSRAPLSAAIERRKEEWVKLVKDAGKKISERLGA